MREFYLVPRAMAEKYCTNATASTTTATTTNTSTLPIELQFKRPKKRKISETKDTQGIRGLIDVQINKDLRPAAKALLDYLAPNPLLQWNERGDLGGVLEGQNMVDVLLSALTKTTGRKERERLKFFHRLVPIPREFVSKSVENLLYGGSYKAPNTAVWKPY